MRIKVALISTDGKKTKSVNIAATGATIGEICKAAGIETKDKDFTLNGKPAGLDTHVGKNDLLAAESRKAPPVEVSARPQGS